MIENIAKTMQFLEMDVSNMKFEPCEKNMYKFEDEQIDKVWRGMYAFYKLGMRDGHNNALNEVAAFAVREIKK